jgi:hypothetical protein
LAVLIMLQWIWEGRYVFELLISFPLAIDPEVELLDLILVLLSIFWKTSILFFIAVTPFYIPTSSCKYWYLLPFVFLINVILTRVGWYPSEVLISTSLIISGVRHLFIFHGWPFIYILLRNVYTIPF